MDKIANASFCVPSTTKALILQLQSFIPIQKQTAHHIQSVPDFHFPSTRLHHLPNPQKSPWILNLTELRNNRCMQHKPTCPFENLMPKPWKSNIKLLKKFCPQALTHLPSQFTTERKRNIIIGLLIKVNNTLQHFLF